ncbi:hypothetical protein FE789_16245 [Burkholderia pseudomallei]|nr:hypothetical protein FE789_16245 [Burkholderia pseudomallei]
MRGMCHDSLLERLRRPRGASRVSLCGGTPLAATASAAAVAASAAARAAAAVERRKLSFCGAFR